MKIALKILWISVLSTLVKMLAQLLSKDGFRNFSSLKTAVGDIPYEFILVNLLVFVILSVLFVLLNDKIPSTKLSKGLLYSISISLVWFVLRFEPNSYDSIWDYLVDTVVFFAPMIIYGVFLGYLSTQKRHLVDFSKSYLSSLIIGSLWVILRVVYFIIDVDEPKTNDYVSVSIWLFSAGIVIGGIFWMIYKNIRLKKLQSALWILAISIVIFGSFYAFEFITLKTFYPLILLKIGFDIIAILVGTFTGHLIFKKELDKKATS